MTHSLSILYSSAKAAAVGRCRKKAAGAAVAPIAGTATDQSATADPYDATATTPKLFQRKFR